MTNLSPLELFKQLVEQRINVTAWLDDLVLPNHDFAIEFEYRDLLDATDYKCLTAYYDVMGEEVINAIILSWPISIPND